MEGLSCKNIVFLTSILSVFVKRVDSVTAAEMKTHITSTFTNYDTRVRPVLSDQSQAIQVTLDFYLVSINNFDSSQQKLETTGYLDITWTDQVLADSWSNAAVDEILVPQNEIWLPDLALQNGFESLTGLGNTFHNVKIAKAGQVTWRPYQVFESACNVEITYFPFDKTTCELKFVIWSNPKDLLLAKKGSEGLNTGLYGANSEWTLLKTTETEFTTNTSSGVTFSVEMKRKPLFYLLNILVPVVMLAVLNPFVFALPVASGEKTGFAVTAFLAFAVFLTIISAELPENSERMSTFSAYLFLMTFVSTLISLITIAELRLSSRDTDVPVPGGLQSITRCVRSIRIRKCCGGDGAYIRGMKMSVMMSRLADDVTWEDAIDSLDFILFWVFFLITVIVTTACFVIASVGGVA
ncbi:acetylcholine receptor subunit beta-type acr-3-like [Mercenaria mercenaria]|uniref:acetylcholine receptor subunit beta-type acr-3-like n=1 Tax=Mercenaria mercenaria TaxID=6596 RepID=UPI001E1D9728|nr:acetylcholine receptor subunit beta-type acr-3-like [Mercenaria mercenaria]